MPRTYSTDDIELIDQFGAFKARQSVWGFRRYMRPKMKLGWWQRDLCAHLMEFKRALIAGEAPMLFVQAPPQHGKSETINDFIAWLLGNHPELMTMFASYSDRLGVRANLSFQRYLRSEKYAKVFPEPILRQGGVVTQDFMELQGKGYWRNTTVRGPVTGEGLDLGIIDDPIKSREEANSALIRDRTWDWFTDDFMSRFSEEAGLLGIMTRWNIDDLFGRAQKAFPKAKVVTYRAIAEEDEDCRKIGEPLFPEHKSLPFLNIRKDAMMPHNWNALYQQHPTLAEGELFETAWLKAVSPQALPPIKYRMIFADTGQKTKEQNDYSCFQCWGAHGQNEAILLDMIHGRWKAPQLRTQASAFWDKHATMTGVGRLRRMNVEDKVSGTSLIQDLEGNIPVFGIQRGTDKVFRANDVSPLVQAGRVSYVTGVPHLSQLLTELAAFPSAPNDDTVDPFMDAVMELCGGGNRSTAGVW